jgi:uncharacterized protein
LKFVIVLVAVLVLAALLWGRRSRDRDDAPKTRRAKKSRAAPEVMLACAHCGVHLPASDAVPLGERAYCSAAHRDAGPRAPHG